jgi:predicted esterase
MSFFVHLDKVPLILKSPEGTLFSEGICFSPEGQEHYKNALAVFTHGYTAEKTPLLPWAIRLADFGIPTIIFDLPGHYLASFTELDSFENFKANAHKLFSVALHELKLKSKFQMNAETRIILGGHSMGGLLSLKALMNDDLSPYTKLGLGVGVGIQDGEKKHLFETKFYEKTMHIRSQLVSPHLNPTDVFSWLYEEKKNIQTFHQRISLITGEDDAVVSHHGAERFKSLLEDHSNIVNLEKPSKLPHNSPELAAGSVYRQVKEFLITVS